MVRDGYLYGIGLFAVAVVLHLLTGSWILTAIPILLAVFFLWFFRDPIREVPQDFGLVVSPADGIVTEVLPVHMPQGDPTGDHIRLSIFLSVFDVHVNRSPITGVIREARYKKGEYLNAMNPLSADRNEQNIVTVEADGYQVVFKQIAGLLARRIVFNHKIGDQVIRGQRVGLIKFGSRVDVLLPPSALVRVAKGQRVKGGASILADVSSASAVQVAMSEASAPVEIGV